MAEPPKIHKMMISTIDNECFICMSQDQDQIKLNCNHTMYELYYRVY